MAIAETLAARDPGHADWQVDIAFFARSLACLWDYSRRIAARTY